MIWPPEIVRIVDGSYWQPFCSGLQVHVLRFRITVVCQFSAILLKPSCVKVWCKWGLCFLLFSFFLQPPLFLPPPPPPPPKKKKKKKNNNKKKKWGGWGCEVSCGDHRPRGKTTTGSALDGAVFDIAQILAYLVHNMSRSQLYLGFGHFGWLPSFFGQ